ncbi:MAG TPA: ribose 5-phosphate isomerase B [candidate division WOR-3 bacterium]|uniref:Ribose 5-phosphate isomerase B n=1 Tax=candidate division WOR-3 bacterium TaxID=2052148 RepID=A0A9C9ELC7_UNCW3|nr:ribose 5-phosphate isomerase B [candidate division WOR-3 bacterium]
MKIGIGADHRGVLLKRKIIEFLTESGHKVIDYGTDSAESVDYPKIALSLADGLIKKRFKFGILICYTGQGMAMTANKVRGIRAAVCTSSEIARLTRAHNDANILVLPGGFVRFNKKLCFLINIFLTTKFEGGRHRRRINMIKDYEKRVLCKCRTRSSRLKS